MKRQLQHRPNVEKRCPVRLLGQQLFDVPERGVRLVGTGQFIDLLDVGRQVGAAEFQFLAAAARAQGVGIDGHDAHFQANGGVNGERTFIVPNAKRRDDPSP